MSSEGTGQPAQPEPQPSPSTISSAAKPAPRQNRGKGSVQKRINNYRQQKGKQTMVANQKRIDSVLFKHLSTLSSKLQIFNAQSFPASCALPLTTRGIACISKYAFDIANSIIPCPTLNAARLYRLSLYQFEYKLQLAMEKQNDEYVYQAPQKRYPNLDYNFEKVIKANPRNFTIMSAALNTVGNFEAFGKTYYPYLPKSSQKHLLVRCNHVCQPAHTEVVRTDWILDPYVITASTLEDTRFRASNDNQLAHNRRFFCERSPIPLFEVADDRLVDDPNIIHWPYDANDLRRDFHHLNDWLDRFPVEYHSWKGKVDWTPNGTEALLVNSKIDILRAVPNRGRFASIENITDANFCYGILGLFGELPDHQSATHDMLRAEPAKLWQPRQLTICGRRMDVSWNDIARQFMSNHG